MIRPDWVEVVSGIFTEDPDAMGATGPVMCNLIVQMIADGELASVQQARDVIRDSFEIKIYEP